MVVYNQVVSIGTSVSFIISLLHLSVNTISYNNFTYY